MSMTVTDMATAVLRELGVLGSNQSATAEEADTVKEAYYSWRRTAQNRQIIDWYNDDDELPDGAEHGTVLCVCNRVYRQFRVERDPSWIVEGEASLSDYMHNNAPAPQTPIVNY